MLRYRLWDAVVDRSESVQDGGSELDVVAIGLSFGTYDASQQTKERRWDHLLYLLGS